MSVSGQIDRIARELWKEIPRPRRKVPKAQKSWHQLHVGQRLQSAIPILIKGQRLASGTEWEVTAVDSRGADLTCRQSGGNIVVRWTNPDWGGVFQRAKRKRKS